MINWSKRLAASVAATSLLLASGAIANVVSHAEVAILIPGAMPFKQINPVYPSVAESYPSIGMHFHTVGATTRLIDYSQDPLAADWALRDGVEQAAEDFPDGEVVIIGESMGSMVAWRLAKELADGAQPPDPGRVSVVLIAPPEVGVAEYFKEGTFIPILNYRITRIAESPYDTTIVIGEYDGWSDPPDRPWNLVSSANALAGISYVHGPPSFTADVGGLTPESEIPGDDEHGSITTYLVPTKNLPLTQVFRDVGVPDALVDKADQVLRPVIDAGYVRHDQPGDSRPYLYDGEIHRNVQSQQQAREPLGVQNNGSDISEQRPAHRGELRQAVQAVGSDLRDRVAAGFRRLKERVTGGQDDRASSTETVTP
jgi:pimeloyl-ACP methyl ester carboxylesterase